MPIDAGIYAQYANMGGEPARGLMAGIQSGMQMAQQARNNQRQDTADAQHNMAFGNAQQDRAAAQQQAQQAQEAAYMRGVAHRISVAPENKDAILEDAKKYAAGNNIPPSHVDWLGNDLSKAKDVKEVAQISLMHSVTPDEAAKLQIANQNKLADIEAQKQARIAEAKMKYQSQQSAPPAVAKGYRNIPDGQGGWSQEAIPGSQPYQTMKSKEAPDRAVVQTLVPQFDKNQADIQSLIDDKGFDSIFGLVGGNTPNWSKDARSAAQKRDQVVGAMETAGMQLQRSTAGSAGSMTEKEWPKMQSYIQVIKNSNDPVEVKDALIGAKQTFERMKGVAEESYLNEWGNSQFGDKTVVDRIHKGIQQRNQNAANEINGTRNPPQAQYGQNPPQAQNAHGNGISVTDPQGGVHVFRDIQSANAFKQAAGIR